MGTLLTFDPAIFPLLWAVKLAAALVLFEVSAARVVVAWNEVDAEANEYMKREIMNAVMNVRKFLSQKELTSTLFC